MAENIVNIGPGIASDLVHEDAPTDHVLIARCQRGELDAYEFLVNRYRQRVHGLVYSMVRNETDATDLCQETFVKAWQAIGRFKGQSSFYTWLYRIASNLCVDLARQRARRPTTPFEETVDPEADVNLTVAPSNQPLPTDELRRRELGAQIQTALMELSPEHRAVIQLREYDGLDYAAIARAVGCSIGTVMSRLHYARKHLQKLLRDVL
jgi:RNA polymerase sigma-70 factor (ECF subfamily)